MTVKAFAEYGFDNYAVDANHVAVTINGGMTGYSGNRFASFATQFQPRGNVTKVSRLISGSPPPGSGTFTIAHSQYDNAGNVVKTIDALGNAATISYTDDFGDRSLTGGSKRHRN